MAKGQTVNLLVDTFAGSNPALSTRQYYRGVEQPVARRAHNPEVVGSNPTPATKIIYGAHIAQSAERILGKDEVTGSIPVVSSILMFKSICRIKLTQSRKN